MTSLPPDWPLIREIVRIVHADPCGGIHRDALAEKLHLPARGRVLGDALGIAYRNKKIDFCGQYVVKPLHTLEIWKGRKLAGDVDGTFPRAVFSS